MGKEWVAATAGFFLIFLTSCGDANNEGTGRAGSGESSPSAQPTDLTGCAALWTSVRETVVDSGLPDGVARRQADLARAECEERILATQTPPTVIEKTFACAEDEPAEATVSNEQKSVAVYFSCVATSAGAGFPVYEFIRPVESSDDLASRIDSAIMAYLAGPTDAEAARGYFAVIANPLTDPIADIRVDNGVAVVNFTPAMPERNGGFTTTAGENAIRELAWTVFQFDGVTELHLEVGGDCAQFWHMFESICHAVTPEAVR